MLPPETPACPNCATAVFVADRTASQLPQISGYDLLGRIGEGGMGTIYLAEEKSLARRVAIKVVSGKFATDAQARARFLREARSLATVEHANVVRIYAFGEVDGQPYLAMQYVDGETLAERIRREGRLATDEALRITRQILVALEAAWEKGIVHRDIKPSNVLLDRRGHIHVADFGLAKATQAPEDASLTGTGHVLGTPYYVAPEQAQGKRADFRADIYSCGILLYEMLAGERPFEGTTPFAIVAKHIGEPMPPIQSKRPDVSPRVARLLEQMTAKSPDRRPASYRDLIAEIETIVGITPPSMRSSTLPLAPLPGDFRRAALATALILVVLTAGGVTLYRLMPETRTAPISLTAPDNRMVVGVTPFYGPDADSAKEGRVMAALVERSIIAKLGSDNVKIAGIDQTKEPVRDHEAARAVGQRFGAAVVVWGEAFVLRNETEVQPYFTLVRQKPRSSNSGEVKSSSRDVDLESADPLSQFGEQSSAVLRLETETPNQIEVRKTSAEGIGQMVSFLAAIHALHVEDNPSKALRFFEQAPATAEVQRHRAHAYLRNGDPASAAKSLEAAMRLEPAHVQGRANLADVYMLENRVSEATAAYMAVAASGHPFTTSQGIVSGGRLYQREIYQNPSSGEVVDGATLLVVNPATGETNSRYRLPGVIRSFAPAKDGFTISYEIDKAGKQLDRLTFANGRFDRPLHAGGNLMLRMNAMRAGWVLPNNFLGGVTGIIEKQPANPRFHLADKDVKESLPKTLPDLEIALRAASKRDRTQPWHLFFLGQALEAQGKKSEAASVWNELVTSDFPGVPYTNYNWMAKYFERYGQREWADRVYEKALRERRRLAQPIIATTLIERLINVAFMRVHPSQLQDPERAYTWFVRAREISGITESDNYAASAWAGWFRRHGDAKRAAREREYAAAAARNAFNFTSLATLVDYAVYFYVAALFGFVMTTLLLIGRAVTAARDANFQRQYVRNALRRMTGRNLPPLWGAVVLGLEIAAAMFVVLGFLADFTWAHIAVVLFVAIVLCGVLLPTLRPVTAIRMMQRRERLTIAALLALFVIAHFTLLTVYRRIYSFAAIDIGVADSLGHAAIVQSFERRLAAQPSPEARYVTAVANELAGNRTRADELYAQLPNDPRAAAARGKLDRPRRIIAPTDAEFVAVYREPWRPFLKASDSVGFVQLAKMADVASIVVALAGSTLLILFLGLRRAEPRATRVNKTLCLLVPGAYDLRHASAALGAILAVLTGFVIWLALAFRFAFPVLYSPGPITARALPNIKLAFPFPPVDSAIDLIQAPIYATQFWSVAGLATIAWLVLHCMRIPVILRSPGRDDA